MLPMNLATYGWELNQIKMKLFHIHVESGRRLAFQAQAYIDGDQEKLQETLENIYCYDSIKTAKRSLDDVRKEIEESINNNLRLFQNANFLLKKAGEEPLDLNKLKVSGVEIDNILAQNVREDIYEGLNAYREYLDKFLDSVNEICNTLPFKLNKISFDYLAGGGIELLPVRRSFFYELKVVGFL